MIKVKTEHLAANVVHFVVDIVTIVETIISLDSLDPLDKLVSANLRKLTAMVYASCSRDGVVLQPEDIASILLSLSATKLAAQAKCFYLSLGYQQLAEPSLLDLIRTISIVAEMKHDMTIALQAIAQPVNEIQLKLQAVMPNNAEWASNAAFSVVHKNYPYAWAHARAEAEVIAYEHILPGGLVDDEHIIYIGTSAPPFSALALLYAMKQRNLKSKVVYLDSDEESAKLGQLEISYLERLGIIKPCEIRVIHTNHQQVLDYNALLGTIPRIAVITAAIINKCLAAQVCKASGIETITVLNVGGLAQLLYYPFEPEQIAALSYLQRAEVLPSLSIALEAKQGIGLVIPESQHQFCVTPAVFSKYPWQAKNHQRVIDPLPVTSGECS